MTDKKKTALGPGAVCCGNTEECELPCLPKSAALTPFPGADELEPTDVELDEIEADPFGIKGEDPK